MIDLHEEKAAIDKERLMWQIACYPGMPDEAVAKYNAIKDTEKRQARNEKAMEIVAKMKELNASER